MSKRPRLYLPILPLLATLAAARAAPGDARNAPPSTVAAIGALLAGRYENSAQVARGNARHETPPPQHVVVTIEPTAQQDWQLWRVHMDVDPAVARTAGSDTSLDAVWAINIAADADGRTLRLIPYTLNPSVDAEAVRASAFDRSQWFSLEACMLAGDLSATRIAVQVPPNEMCVAETMGLGGKRAFLPTWVRREGDLLQIQLIYFGKPWRVRAHRVGAPPPG